MFSKNSTGVLNLNTLSRPLVFFAWVFPFSATSCLHYTTFWSHILYFLLHCIYLITVVTNYFAVFFIFSLVGIQNTKGCYVISDPIIGLASFHRIQYINTCKNMYNSLYLHAVKECK